MNVVKFKSEKQRKMKNLFSLVEILFLFNVAFIFEYGYEIQLDSKGKMDGEANE